MTEQQKKYRRENSKRIVINLTLSDYERWRAAADVRSEKLASYIRRLVEASITETENDWEKSITEIVDYQEALKKEGIII